MKRLLCSTVIALLLCFIPFSLISCGDDDESDGYSVLDSLSEMIEKQTTPESSGAVYSEDPLISDGKGEITSAEGTTDAKTSASTATQTDKPAATTAKTENTTAKPAATTASVTTKTPETTTKKPETTKKPGYEGTIVETTPLVTVEITASPETTTNTPETTTNAPETTTNTPETTTAPPVTTTSPGSGNGDNDVDIGNIPGATTSSNTTKAAPETTKSPDGGVWTPDYR